MRLKTRILKQILKNRGIEQKELAGLLGYSPEFLSRVIRGRVSLTEDVLVNLTRVLGVDSKILISSKSNFKNPSVELVSLSKTLGLQTQKKFKILHKKILKISEEFNSLNSTIAHKFNKDLKSAIEKMIIKPGFRRR